MRQPIVVGVGSRRYRVESWQATDTPGVARCVLVPDTETYHSADVIVRDLEITW